MNLKIMCMKITIHGHTLDKKSSSFAKNSFSQSDDSTPCGKGGRAIMSDL